jgi:hypothetical protein
VISLAIGHTWDLMWLPYVVALAITAVKLTSIVRALGILNGTRAAEPRA